jgi:hypothetical protein
MKFIAFVEKERAAGKAMPALPKQRRSLVLQVEKLRRARISAS